MTAAPWWAGLDDPALAALGSAGLLRRARAARVGVAHTEGATAEAEVDGFSVTLGAKGPGSARCPCPATGLCLHILAAILALRSTSPSPNLDVAAEIMALSEADLTAFAASDLPAAVRLVASAPLPDLGDPVPSLTLLLPGLSQPVTFLAGSGLRGAVWKGPEGRRRVAVAAAALALRASRGIPLPASAAGVAEGLDRTLLATIASGIEASVAPVLAGCGALAADRLLDLALSARIDGALRLAAALRKLVELAVSLEDRAPDADATAFLIAAARAQGLTHALSGPDPDPRLQGVLRRDYRQAPPLSLWMLGARVWRAQNGARGLRLWGWDPDSGRWVATGAARPDGLDAGFDPVAAYRRPMLGLPSAAQAIGSIIGITAPLLSDDLRLSADCVALVRPMPGLVLPEVADWATLTRDLRRRMGPSLLRDGQVHAALLAPSVCEAPLQAGSRWELPLRDASGHTLTVTLDGLPGRAVTALAQLPSRARLLVEAREDLGRLGFDLVSVLSPEQAPTVWNPSLDPPPTWPKFGWSKPGWLTQRMPWTRKRHGGDTEAPRQSLASDLLLAALDLGQGHAPAPQLVARIAACDIAAMDRLLSPPATAAKALRLAWVAAELLGHADQ